VAETMGMDRPIRILVVDDEENIRELLAMGLRYEGFEVEVGDGGRAALASVPRSIADPVGSLETNINGTQNVLLAARDSGVRRVVYASSSSVYGNTPVKGAKGNG